jgi:protein SCO1/2
VKKIVLILFPFIISAVAYFIVIPEIERNKFNFTLQSANGDVSLKDFRGEKAVGVYFGYTYCPDICPTTLSTMTAAFEQLTPEEQSQFQMIFVSVDVGRDNPQDLKSYVKYFHPSYIGVTSDTKEKIDAVVEKFDGTKYSIVEDGSGALGYTVAHTSMVYFFNKKGDFSSLLVHSIDPQDSLGHIKKALE